MTLLLLNHLSATIPSLPEIKLLQAIHHPSNVLHLNLAKPPNFNFLPGQSIRLICPKISFFQKHDFTITSAPHEDIISLHIRIAGDWTLSLSHLLGITAQRLSSSSQSKFLPTTAAPSRRLDIPGFRIQGPYGAPSQEYIHYESLVFVAAGVGVTPFASILKSIWSVTLTHHQIYQSR